MTPVEFDHIIVQDIDSPIGVAATRVVKEKTVKMENLILVLGVGSGISRDVKLRDVELLRLFRCLKAVGC